MIFTICFPAGLFQSLKYFTTVLDTNLESVKLTAFLDTVH